MSKFYSITREQVAEMINEVNEYITAVTETTITETATAIQDSIHEDCIWSETDADVTFASLIACVREWLTNRVEQAEEAALEAVLAGFPVRIRTEAQIAHILHCYNVAMQMVEMLNPTPELMRECIEKWEAMNTDDTLAMAAAYRTALAVR